MGARAVKYKFGARADKRKLGARAGGREIQIPNFKRVLSIAHRYYDVIF